MKKCCDNCKHSETAKGSFMGQYDYWCRITHGQKSASHVCDLHEYDEDEMLDE